MKYVVIRDDDICSYTQVEMLSVLYEPLIMAGKSVGLSVIPAIEGGHPAGELNGPFWEKYRLDYSPCIPPESRSLQQTRVLDPESEIVTYLRNTPEYELVQHGFNHISIDGVREGMLTDPDAILKKIEESRRVFTGCFGKECEFFVAPWDDVSPQVMTALKKHFKGVSLHRLGQRHVSWSRKVPAALRRFQKDLQRKPFFQDGNFLLLEYPGPILSMFGDCSAMKGQVIDYLQHHDILILVNHYWEYFWDWGKANDEFVTAWHDIAHYLLERADVEIISFSQLYDHIYS